MSRPRDTEAFCDVYLNKAEKYVLNLKWFKLFAFMLKPLLRLFSDKILKKILLFVKGMCANCYMRFFCISYLFATMGIKGADVLSIYEEMLKDCPRIMRKGEGLFRYDSEDKMETGVGFRIPSVRQKSDIAKPYLQYLETCIKCERFTECSALHLPVKADQLLDGLIMVFENCERMRNNGMCWKAKREITLP